MTEQVVHVVCVTYNSCSTIEALLGSLKRQDGSVGRVTVVDNGSSDDTVERAERAGRTLGLPLVVLRSTNVGFARGVNRGVRDAPVGGPVLCVNPDVVLSDGVVPAMLEVLSGVPGAGLVGAPLHLPDGTEDPSSRRRLPKSGTASVYAVLGRKFTPRPWRYNAVDRLDQVASCNGAIDVEATTGALMLVASDLVPTDGRLFDPGYFMYGEDLQLCLDIRRAGRRVLLVGRDGGLHVKGVSSGLPRSARSNRAFHHAMWRYFRTNLSPHPILVPVVWLAICLRFAVSEIRATPARWRRRSPW